MYTTYSNFFSITWWNDYGIMRSVNWLKDVPLNFSFSERLARAKGLCSHWQIWRGKPVGESNGKKWFLFPCHLEETWRRLKERYAEDVTHDIRSYGEPGESQTVQLIPQYHPVRNWHSFLPLFSADRLLRNPWNQVRRLFYSHSTKSEGPSGCRMVDQGNQMFGNSRILLRNGIDSWIRGYFKLACAYQMPVVNAASS